MAYENRLTRDFTIGTILTPVALSDTTITSDAFAALGSAYNASTYIPLTLHLPAEGRAEVVWVTGHEAGSSAVTVIRGREETSAQAWPAGTEVLCAPLRRDLIVGVPDRASLPADPHTGMRALSGVDGKVFERVGPAWVTPTNFASPNHEIGPRRGGAVPPDTSIQQIRSGQVAGTTNASGDFVVTYRVPFRTNTNVAVCTNSNLAAFSGHFVAHAESATGFTVRAIAAPGSAAPNQAFGIGYIATGW
ncbi:hypothetical protein [Actinoalloteichus sp. GBA129-24]|uniref:hypothetical protein n=1 Tax=Actinoalloteichus sp. GBA129-24 TaxID=1612551 RepID=UPI000950555B|nr:hypothetical protein [Actinoalloteichus sp. GBA129-24]APU20954.1 hypothetical protein UA75_14720 [Actinoalloteichus sp. GBA129-24]APU24203.1 hypothetical protein UA75_31200 [Actinoalloteichus sp. GBA129-24]